MSVKENSSSRSDKIRLERNWKRLKSTEILLDVAERTPRPSGGISFNKEFVLASTDGINYERESISRFLDAEDLFLLVLLRRRLRFTERWEAVWRAIP